MRGLSALTSNCQLGKDTTMNAFSRLLFPPLDLEKRSRTLFQLFPPFLVGMVEPVTGHDGGVNAGDGTASDWVPITTPSAGQPVEFRIRRQLVDTNLNRIAKIRYVLKRKATGQYSDSEALDLLIGRLPPA